MSTIQNLNNGETGLSHRNKLNTNFSNLNTDKVETSVTVNGHDLSSNVTLTTDDVAEGSTNKYDEVVALLSGAGIQVTGTYPNFTVTNTSPDQVVSLTEGTNVTITGTYPNFTIAATGGSGSGDVTASGTLTDDSIILGGGTKTVKTSGKSIVSVLIGSNDAVPTDYAVTNAVNAKQDTLVSGTNIKTVNGTTILGSGDLEISAGSGGYAANVYLTTLTSTVVGTYKQTSYTPEVSETLISGTANNNTVLIQSYVFDLPLGVTSIDAGTWEFHPTLYVNSNAGTTRFIVETYKRTVGGTETLLFTTTSPEINNTTRTTLTISTTQPAFTVNATDYLVTKTYVSTTSGTNKTLTYVVGAGDATHFLTPLALRHNQLRARDVADSHPATAITNTPAGSITATTVQAALNELDTEKVPTTRTITINGVTQDLSDDRSWTISAGGPSIVAEFATSGTAYAGVVYEKSGRAFTVTSLLISLATRPVGGNFEVNVKKNGTTILSGNLVITTTESASNSLYVVQTGDSGKATVSTSSFSSKDRLTIEVVAGSGNTFLGAGVNIQLIGTIS